MGSHLEHLVALSVAQAPAPEAIASFVEAARGHEGGEGFKGVSDLLTCPIRGRQRAGIGFIGHVGMLPQHVREEGGWDGC